MHQEVTPKINDTRGRCKAIGDTAFNTTKGEQKNDEQNAWHYNTTLIKYPWGGLTKSQWNRNVKETVTMQLTKEYCHFFAVFNKINSKFKKINHRNNSLRGEISF